MTKYTRYDIFIILGILTNQVFNKFIPSHPATECRKTHIPPH